MIRDDLKPSAHSLTLLIQQILFEPDWMGQMGVNELKALTPLIYAHVNPYGVFRPAQLTKREKGERKARREAETDRS